MRIRGTGWTGRTARWLTIPLSAICLVAQLSSAAHFVLVRHEMCLEHGQAMDSALGHGVAREATRAQIDAAAGIRSASGIAREHAHDHCLLAYDRRESVSPVRDAGTLVAARPTHVVALVADDAARPARVAIFRLAPKSSPPV